jgi:hypothetical protein
MGQSPFRVKAEVKFPLLLSPAAVGRRSSEDEKKASDTIPDRRGCLLKIPGNVYNIEGSHGK